MAVLMREAIGDSLRRARTARRRTLREVSRRARVSLGYLSEVERGRKEASSELLAAICEALDLSIPELLRNVAADISAMEGVEHAQTVPDGVRDTDRVPVSTMEGGGKLVTGRLGNELTEFKLQQPILGASYQASSYQTSLPTRAGVVVAA
jgi:transcriptional regulator with XRE-family HTH domain